MLTQKKHTCLFHRIGALIVFLYLALCANPVLGGLPSYPPIVDDIPDQIITEGQSFAPIYLDDFVSDENHSDSEIIWTYHYNDDLLVIIEDRVAYVSVPHTDWNGSDTIKFKARDPIDLGDDDSVTFTVTPVNDAPIAVDDSYETNEDIPLVIEAPGVLINDSDVENETLIALLVSSPDHGSLSLSADGSFNYTPLPDYNGSDSFTYRANDGNVSSERPATVAISVAANNDAPTVADPIEDFAVDEDANDTSIDLSIIFADPDILTNGDELSYSITDNTNSTLVTAGITATDLTLAYAENQFGSATITIRATDLSNAWVENTFGVRVNSMNDAPTTVSAFSDVTASEDANDTQIQNVSAYFADVDVATNNDQLNYTVVTSNPTIVTADIIDDALILDYQDHWFGQAGITVRATDLANAWVETTFAVAVHSENDDPIIATAFEDLMVVEDADDTTIDLNAIFYDPDVVVTQSDTLTYELGNTNESLVAASVEAENHTLTLDYLDNQFGTATITIRANDNSNAWVEDTFMVTVNSENDAPTVIATIPDVNVDEDANDTSIDLSIIFADPDILTNGDELSYSITDNTNNTLVTAGITATDLTLAYAANQFGSATITIRATDLSNAWVENTFAVRVNSVNDDPTIVSVFTDVTVEEDADDTQIQNVSAYFADVDIATNNDQLSYTVVSSNPTIVTADIVGDALILDYRDHWFGQAGITVRATDLANAWVETTFSVTVHSENDDPIIATAFEDLMVVEDADDTTIDLNAIFYDPDVVVTQSDTLTYELGNTNESLVAASVDAENHTLTLDYLDNQFGTGIITVTAIDQEGVSVEDTLMLNVSSVNDAPTIVSAFPDVTVDEDAEDTQVQYISAYFTDVDIATSNDQLTYAAVSSNPTLVAADIVNGDLILDYQNHWFGQASITIRATDLANAWVETTFSVTVHSQNDDPILATAFEDLMVMEDADDTTIDLSAIFYDPDVVVTRSDHLIYTNSIDQITDTPFVSTDINNGILTLNYLENQYGQAIVTVFATDQNGQGVTVDDSFLITVNPINDRPVIQDYAPYEEIYENESLGISLDHLTVVDPDNSYPEGFALDIEASGNYTITESTIIPTPGILADLENGILIVRVRVSDGGLPDLGLLSEWSEWYDLEISVRDAGRPCSTASAPASFVGQGQVVITYMAYDSYANEICGPNSNGDGLASVELFVKEPLSETFIPFATNISSSDQGQFTYPLTQDGMYYFYTLASDQAGNEEEPPSEGHETQILHANNFAGYFIMAVGDAAGDDAQTYTRTGNGIYQRLIDRNFSLVEDPLDPLDHIKYFHPGSQEQIGEDDYSAGSLQTAITTWAVDKMQLMAGPLYILLIGNADNPDVFELNSGDQVQAEDLAAWLDTLADFMVAENIEQPIVIILGFDHSESFIDNLSGPGRVIVASSRNNEISVQGPQAPPGTAGNFFLEALFDQWSRINPWAGDEDDPYQRLDLNAAFEIAVRQTEEYTENGSRFEYFPHFDTAGQHPLLDDNGDSQGSNDLNPEANREGLFQPPVEYNVGQEPMMVAAADFNDDGRVDLAVVNADSATVSVLRNQIDGTFEETYSYSVGGAPTDLIVDDLNQDGLVDIVTVNTATDDVSLLQGLTNDEFQDATAYPVGDAPSDLALGDLNQDGIMDLVVANQDADSVAVLLGAIDNGIFSFDAAGFHDTGVAPSAVSLGDFNADMHLDMAVANYSSQSVSIFLGNGDGTFSDSDGDGMLDAADACPDDPFKTEPGVCGCGSVDQDRDGDETLDCEDQCPYDPFKQELGECGCGIPDSVNGSGEPECINPCGDSPGSNPYNATDCYDLCPDDPDKAEPGICGCNVPDTDSDLDGTPDCKDTCPHDTNKIFPGTTGCGVAEPEAIEHAAGGMPSDMAAADFDGDGNLDLAVTNQETDQVSILYGNGDGTFDQKMTTFDVGDQPANLIADDFNGDGQLDIAVTHIGIDLVAVMYGSSADFRNIVFYRTGIDPRGLAATKIDADSVSDLVIANSGGNSISVYLTDDSDTNLDLAPDGAKAKEIFLGYQTDYDDRPKRLTIEKTGASPQILPAHDPEADFDLNNDNAKAMLWLTVDNPDLVESAWVEIRRPGFQVSQAPDSAVIPEDRIELSGPDAAGRFEAEYDEITKPGKYQLFFFVQDTEDVISSVALPDSYSYTTSIFTNSVSELRDGKFVSPFTKYLYKNDPDNAPPVFHSYINVTDNDERLIDDGVMLAWSAAVDEDDDLPDGVSYAIEIYKNDLLKLRQENITETHYLLPPSLLTDSDLVHEEVRVRIVIYAIDDYGKQSSLATSLSANNVQFSTGTAGEGLLAVRLYNTNRLDWPINTGTFEIVGHTPPRTFNKGGSFTASLDDGWYTVVVRADGYMTDYNVGIRVHELDVTRHVIELDPIDSDGDHVPDDEDDFVYDETEWLDSDDDGTGNNKDPDDDNDGMLDECETQYNVPELDPLIPNDGTEDLDGDGISNFDECHFEWDPTDPEDPNPNNDTDTDSDGDGHPDIADACPHHPGGWRYNTDGDEECDITDEDDDGDGMPDVWEDLYTPGPDSLIFDSLFDWDNDKIPNIEEYRQGSDPTQAPSDTETDTDGDGVPDERDAFPDDPDEWLDSDNDGIGNNADPDDDNDGMPDIWELQYSPPLNPLFNDAQLDPDDDLSVNLAEYQEGTDPTRAPLDNQTDSDGDGIPDYLDRFPNDPNEWLDHDNDGIGNNADPDDDNDGMPDEWERANGLQQYVNDALNDPDKDLIANIDEYLNGTNPKNAVPDRPIPLEPADGAGNQPLTPVLKTHPFKDVNNDQHDASQWQISLDAEFTDLVLNVTSDMNLTDLSIPELLLTYAETYYWRVRFYDDNQNAYDEVSAWSPVSAFSVITDSPDDDDGDGTPNDQEIDDDQFLDMDANGINDLEQDDMGCINAGPGGEALCLKVPESVLSIDSMSWVNPDSIAATDNRPIALPFGLVSFRLSVIPGAEVEVTLFLSDAAGSELEWYKYDAISGWQNYHSYAEFSIDRTSVTIQLKDGDFGDGDGIENGTLIDPSGPGSNPRTIYDDYDGIDGNSPYGCFIQAIK